MFEKRFEPGDVVLVKSNHKSFMWNNGLYVMIKQVDDILHLQHLDKDGKLKYYEDNITPDIMCTSTRNTDLFKTKLQFEL